MVRVHKAADGKIKQSVEFSSSNLVADEPAPVGDDQGPSPHDLLNASLAVCTAMTVTMVARRKQWPLEDVRVEIIHDEDDTTYRMSRTVELVGQLSDEQKQYLLGIANKCPIHRALQKKFEIATSLV